jgi:hypothetical protein
MRNVYPVKKYRTRISECALKARNYFDAVPDTRERDELEILGKLIDDYENTREHLPG